MTTHGSPTPQIQGERVDDVDPAIAALMAQAKEDRRRDEEERREEEEAAKRRAEERARRQVAQEEQIQRAREEAECKRREAEEKRLKEEEDRRKKKEEELKRRMEEEERRRREAEAKEEEEATKKGKRDKGKEKAKEVEVMSLDDEDEDDGGDDDNDDRRANRAYVEVPTTLRPTKRRRVGEKVRLGGDRPCQRCVDGGRVCKVHPSSTVTKCLACTRQKLRCEAADGSPPQGSGLTLRIGPSKVARERESKDLQEVLDQLATLRAELAIEREARRQERGRLLDVVEHIAIGVFGIRDAVRRLEDRMELAGKLGSWEAYVEEMERQEEEHRRKTEEGQREKEREEREQEEDRGEGPSAPSS